MRPGERLSRAGSPGYFNGVLTVIAVALVVIAVQVTGGGSATAEAAQRGGARDSGDPLGVPNAFAQRERMIRAMESMETRMKALESRLGGSTPIDVKVVNAAEMASAPVRERE